MDSPGTTSPAAELIRTRLDVLNPELSTADRHRADRSWVSFIGDGDAIPWHVPTFRGTPA